MRLSAPETSRINQKLEGKRQVACTTFDYAKTIELYANKEIKGRFRTLQDAKGHAVVFQRRNPDMYVKVVVLKKTVHEFRVLPEGGKP